MTVVLARVRHRLTFKWTDWSTWTDTGVPAPVTRTVTDVAGFRVALAVLLHRHTIEMEFRYSGSLPQVDRPMMLGPVIRCPILGEHEPHRYMAAQLVGNDEGTAIAKAYVPAWCHGRSV